MPLRYEIIESQRLVLVVIEGRIGLVDLLQHIEVLSRDPRYVPPMKKLVDYRLAEQMGPKSEDIEAFVNSKTLMREIFAHEKCAIVIVNDLDFGMARIFSAKIESANYETNVFRDYRKALDWLEVDLSLSE